MFLLDRAKNYTSKETSDQSEVTVVKEECTGRMAQQVLLAFGREGSGTDISQVAVGTLTLSRHLVSTEAVNARRI